MELENIRSEIVLDGGDNKKILDDIDVLMEMHNTIVKSKSIVLLLVLEDCILDNCAFIESHAERETCIHYIKLKQKIINDSQDLRTSKLVKKLMGTLASAVTLVASILLAKYAMKHRAFLLANMKTLYSEYRDTIFQKENIALLIPLMSALGLVNMKGSDDQIKTAAIEYIKTIDDKNAKLKNGTLERTEALDARRTTRRTSKKKKKDTSKDSLVGSATAFGRGNVFGPPTAGRGVFGGDVFGTPTDVRGNAFGQV
jgi:hypothetical protein